MRPTAPTPSRIAVQIVLSVCAILITACQPKVAEERPVTSLEAMERPTGLAVGDVVVWQKNGTSELRSQLTERDESKLTFVQEDGCSFSLPATGFGPATMFKNCEGNSGTQNVQPVSSSPWPLTVGKSWSYEFTGRNTRGDKWDGTRRCNVRSEARVTVPLGSFDTFKVVCNDPWRTRTYYVAPDAPTAAKTVMFIRHHKRRNETTRMELITVEKADAKQTS